MFLDFRNVWYHETNRNYVTNFTTNCKSNVGFKYHSPTRYVSKYEKNFTYIFVLKIYIIFSIYFFLAATFNKSLIRLEELQSQITSDLESNKSLLKGVQESFASNLEIIKNNIESLDERIKKLNKW